MALNESQKHKLKRFMRELRSYRAPHTEFVSVYVPAGYEMNKIISHLSEEQGTATNIKSAVTRKNVIDALERMIQHLKIYKDTPPNGLAAFSGNILAKEGKTDVRVWSIEPPIPLKIRLYRCDKDFKLDILEEMMEVKEVYGLVVLDSRDAIVALLKGKAIIPLHKTHSQVPGKFKAGGQSSMRFQQNRMLALKAHLKKVADIVKDQFLGMENLKGIIVGGPGPHKYEWVEQGYLTGDILKKIIGIKDLSYTEEFGLEELLEKSQDILAKEGVIEEKQIITKFLETLAKEPGKVTYGLEETKKALEMGAVETLLLSEAIDDQIVDELSAIAEQYSTEVKIISTDTREGAQLKDLTGIAGLLRYALS